MSEHLKQGKRTEAEMARFLHELEEKHMDALWNIVKKSPSTPTRVSAYDPCHWKWEDLRAFLYRAGELVEPGPDAERRVVSMINPSLGTVHSAAHTLSANIQMVLPEESAPSHRHHIAGIRFVIEGESVISIVDGEPVTMRPGDLVLTPNWHWHGHLSQSDKPIIWMDSLDGALVRGLRQQVQEPYPDGLQSPTKPSGLSYSLFGAGHLRPVGVKHLLPSSPLYTYPWDETEKVLMRLADHEGDPFDDIAFDYTNPTTGGHVLPTMGCRIQMIRSGVHTKAHRHTYCCVHHVFRGSGTTIVDGIKIDWKQGDFFVTPPNCWHEHLNDSSENAIVFSTNDSPVVEALGLYRDQAYEHNGGHQEVIQGYADRFGYTR